MLLFALVALAVFSKTTTALRVLVEREATTADGGEYEISADFEDSVAGGGDYDVEKDSELEFAEVNDGRQKRRESNA